MRKSMIRKCASFFYFLMRTQSNSALKSPNQGKFTLPSFCDFDAEFDCVLIRKWKKEAHFLIILFCKESKSAIRIWKFWFLKFDLLWPLTPRTWHLDWPQIILTAISLCSGQFGTIICLINKASMNSVFSLGGLRYTKL